MKFYVLCIAMTQTHVVCIKKNRPEWQRGCFNFVGGKYEREDRDIETTAIREFLEETGVRTTIEDWIYMGIMHRVNPSEDADEPQFICNIFFSEDEKFSEARTMEDEEVVLIPRDKFMSMFEEDPSKFISNLNTLFSFAVSDDFKNGAKIEIKY